MGGSDKLIGSAKSATDCVEMVKKKEPTANGVTYATNNIGASWMNCRAEFDAVSISRSSYAVSRDNGYLLTCMFSGRFMKRIDDSLRNSTYFILVNILCFLTYFSIPRQMQRFKRFL